VLKGAFLFEKWQGCPEKERFLSTKRTEMATTPDIWQMLERSGRIFLRDEIT